MEYNHNVSHGSWVWQSMLNCKPSLLNGAFYSVRPHSKLRIQDVPWIHDAPNFKVPTDISIPSQLYYVEDLMWPNGRSWNQALITSIMPPIMARKILKIHILDSLEHDDLIWVPSKSREFSIRSSYRINLRDRVNGFSNFSREEWKRLWLSRLHGRHEALLWRLLSDIIPAKI